MSEKHRIYIEGTEALKPGAALAIFERLVGRPATAAEIAEVERDETEAEDDGDGDGDGA